MSVAISWAKCDILVNVPKSSHIWALTCITMRKQVFSAISVCAGPDVYGPAHMHMGSTCMGCSYAYGTVHTRMDRIPVWDGT